MNLPLAIMSLVFPSTFSGFLRYRSPPLLTENSGTCRAAFASSELATFDGSWVTIILNSVFDLPCSDIDDQLAELDRVARALEALRCHTK